MACPDAARQDAFAQVRLPDDSFEARPGAVAHQTVVHRGELDIFGLVEEEPLRVALHPHRSRKPTRDRPTEPQRRVAVPQERPAVRAQKDEVERQGAAEMAQLQISLEPQVQQLQELRQVSPRLVREQAVAHRLLEMQSQRLAQPREALQQDA
jgi:hypothetical protein